MLSFGLVPWDTGASRACVPTRSVGTRTSRSPANRPIPAAEVWVELASMLRYYTAGESHGKALVALVDGFPAGVELSAELIDAELRSPPGGIRPRRPAAARIRPRRNSQRHLARPVDRQPHRPAGAQQGLQDRADGRARSSRPGHGDLSGSIKYLGSIRGVLERASARETAVRVAAGALAKQLLDALRHRRLRLRDRGRADRRSPAARHDRSSNAHLRDKSELYTLNPDQDAATQDADRRRRKSKATRWAAWSRSASRASPSASARTRNGTRSSTAGWPRP